MSLPTGDNCPKCCGRGVDRRGRVCGYHKPRPDLMAKFIVRQKEEIDRLRGLCREAAGRLETETHHWSRGTSALVERLRKAEQRG